MYYRIKPYFHFFELCLQFFKKHQSISATILGLTSFFLVFAFFSASAKADGNDSLKNIEHHFLSVVEQTPYQVEVCKKVRVDGDKTSEKALFITSGVLYSAGGGAQDPYEKLYIGGLG